MLNSERPTCDNRQDILVHIASLSQYIPRGRKVQLRDTEGFVGLGNI